MPAAYQHRGLKDLITFIARICMAKTSVYINLCYGPFSNDAVTNCLPNKATFHRCLSLVLIRGWSFRSCIQPQLVGISTRSFGSLIPYSWQLRNGWPRQWTGRWEWCPTRSGSCDFKTEIVCVCVCVWPCVWEAHIRSLLLIKAGCYTYRVLQCVIHWNSSYTTQCASQKLRSWQH